MSREIAHRLNTFVAPKPSRVMAAVTSFANRALMFNHVPLLDRVPGLNTIPGIAGFTRIRHIDFPVADVARFEEAVNHQTVSFIAPSHPEFFVDWLVDKELSSRFAPRMASWATHTIVNGMGRIGQWFWLKNNLIAQIPGAGGAAAKRFAVDWALAGNAVLLHPEGQVGWHADQIAPLFPGVAEMAFDAASQTAESLRPKQVYIVPVVWKMQFTGDVSPSLHREMGYVEKRLGLPDASAQPIEKRVFAAQSEMLARAERTWGRDSSNEGLSYAARHSFLMEALLRVSEAKLGLVGEEMTAAEAPRYLTRLEASGRYGEFISRFRRVEKALRAQKKAGAKVSDDTTRAVNTLQKLSMFMPELYTAPTVSQENLAEIIKRIRQVYCKGTLRDALSAMMPRAAGTRTAHIRVAPALNINAYWLKSVGASPQKLAAIRQNILNDLAQAMDSTLDTLVQETSCRTLSFPNPFILNTVPAGRE
jgi:hypothetical protein